MSNDVNDDQRHPLAIYGTRADFERLRGDGFFDQPRTRLRFPSGVPLFAPADAERLRVLLANQPPLTLPAASEPKVEAIGVCLGSLGRVVSFERIDLYTFDLFVSDQPSRLLSVRMVMPNAESAAAFAAYLEAATRQQ